MLVCLDIALLCFCVTSKVLRLQIMQSVFSRVSPNNAISLFSGRQDEEGREFGSLTGDLTDIVKECSIVKKYIKMYTKTQDKVEELRRDVHNVGNNNFEELQRRDFVNILSAPIEDLECSNPLYIPQEDFDFSNPLCVPEDEIQDLRDFVLMKLNSEKEENANQESTIESMNLDMKEKKDMEENQEFTIRKLDSEEDKEMKRKAVGANKKRKRSEEGGRKCSHCKSGNTPQWRIGPKGPKSLCNACGVRYLSGRLIPEYRPAASPTFDQQKHSNFHKKILKRQGLK